MIHNEWKVYFISQVVPLQPYGCKYLKKPMFLKQSSSSKKEEEEEEYISMFMHCSVNNKKWFTRDEKTQDAIKNKKWFTRDDKTQDTKVFIMSAKKCGD